MTEYRTKWTSPLDDGWESDAFVYPSWCELHAEGLHGAADVLVRVEMRDGIPEVVEFKMTAKVGGRAVRTADFHSLGPLEGIALNGMRKFAQPREGRRGTEQPDGTFSIAGPRDEREFWAMGRDLTSAQESRRGPSEAELAEVAAVYRSAIHARPTEAVQIQLGYSRRTAARRIQQARAAGHLPPTSQGRRKG